MTRPAALLSTVRRHPALTTAFVLAAILALMFLVNVVGRVIHWEAHENEPIAPWMTVGYIGHSWDLDPRLLDAVAGTPTPQQSGHPLILVEIARGRGVPVVEAIGQVEAALEAIRSRRREHPKPLGDLEGPGRTAGP